MKKIVLVLPLLIAMVLISCNRGDEKKKGERQETASKEVTVYSSHPADLLNPLVDSFQQETGIKVNVVAAGTGELLKRIEAEKDSPLGDVMWGGGAESLEAYRDYFDTTVPTDSQAIDPNFKSPEQKWIGFSALPLVIMYNKDMVKEEEAPKSWRDLTDPKWKGQIAFADPVKSGSSYTAILTIVQAVSQDDREAGWAFLKEFTTNLDGKILGSSKAVPKGIADKEYPLGVTLEKNAIRYIEAGSNVAMVYPQEGTSVVPDAAGIVKGAKNRETAQEFIDYIVGTSVQERLVNEYKIRGVRGDIASPEGLAEVKDLAVVPYDFSWAALEKSENVNRWKDILIGK